MKFLSNQCVIDILASLISITLDERALNCTNNEMNFKIKEDTDDSPMKHNMWIILTGSTHCFHGSVKTKQNIVHI